MYRFLAPLFLLAACAGPSDTDAETNDGATDAGTTPSDDPCDVPGTICTFAGQAGLAGVGLEDIPATDGPLYLPQDTTVSPDGESLYVLDWNNHRIRVIDADGIIHTVAGNGMLGDGPEGPAMYASFNHPTNVAFDPSNPDRMIIAAWHNSRVEEFHPSDGSLAWIAGTGLRDYSGDGPALTTDLDLVPAVTVDDDGTVYFSDQANQMVRRINADGNIETLAGSYRVAGYSGDGGPASAALLHSSVGQAADPSSRLEIHDRKLYIADTDNNVIRAIDLDTMIIDTYVGMGVAGFSGDEGDAASAQLQFPRDMAFGPNGEMYITDTINSCVRVVGTDNVIRTFAGQCGVIGYAGDGGDRLDAQMWFPYGVSVDADGNVFVADTYNHVIRRIAGGTQ